MSRLARPVRRPRGSRGAAAPPIDEVATVTQRLAVLLTAGVSPVSAWAYLLPPNPAEGDAIEPADQMIHVAAAAGATGGNLGDAVAAQARALAAAERQAWLALAAAWSVATEAGAPLAGALRELAASFRQLGQLERDIGVALAGPAATARIVLGLPLVGLAFGALMGFDTIHALFATVPGLLCLLAGALLVAAAARWNAGLVRRARATDAAPGLELDLTAIAMAGGASVARARDVVAAILTRYGLETGGADATVTAVLDLAARAGVPAAELLRSEAEQLRRAARSDGQRKAETLAVRLMLPLGLCVLPAFMLVGVAPLLLGVLASTFAVL